MATDSTYSVDDLRSIADAGVSLTSELSLEAILQRLVDLASTLVNTRYAAMSVLGRNGRIDKFIYTGISEDERRRIGPLPRGHGLLGVLVQEGTSLRLDDMSSDPRSAGFPPHHPPMRSLLGVPLVLRGDIIGNLYLSDKRDGSTFTDRDEEIIRLLAVQAAAAIETARLRERLESLARLEERERIAMDLHDGVIQSVYAVSLHLENACELVSESPDEAQSVINKGIDDLHQVIRDIRSYIFDLRPQVSEVEDLPGALRELAENVRVNSLIRVSADIPPRVDAPLSPDQALAIFHIAQESLHNVSKHAGASRVRMAFEVEEGRVSLEIEDDGAGFDLRSDRSGEKHGLRNMKDRAKAVGANLFVDSERGHGTMIRVELPIE